MARNTDPNAAERPAAKNTPQKKERLVTALVLLLPRLAYGLVRFLLGLVGIRLPSLKSTGRAVSALAGDASVQDMKTSFARGVWSLLRSRMPGGSGAKAPLGQELRRLWRETRQSAGGVRKALWKRVVKVAGLLVCGPVLVILALLGAAFSFLQTNYGKTFLQDTLNGALEPAGIVISGLDGTIPISTSCSLVMKDDAGAWLEVNDCLVALDFRDLPNALGLVVRAESGHLWRLPPSPEKTAPEPDPADDGTAIDVRLKLEVLTRVTNIIPPWVPGLALRDLAIGNFQVERQVYDAAWGSLPEEERASADNASAITVCLRGDAAVMPDTLERWLTPVTTVDLGLLVLPVPGDVSTDIAAAGFHADGYRERTELPVCSLVSGLGLDCRNASVSVSGTLKDPQLAARVSIGTLDAGGRVLSSPVAHVTATAGWLPELLAGRESVLRLAASAQADSVPVELRLAVGAAFDGLAPVIRLAPAAWGPGLRLNGDITAAFPSSLMEGTRALLSGADAAKDDPELIHVPLERLEGGLRLDISDLRLLPMFVPGMEGRGSFSLALDAARDADKGQHTVTVTAAARDVDVSREGGRLAALTSLDAGVSVGDLDFAAGISLPDVSAALDVTGRQVDIGALDPLDIDLHTRAALAGLNLDVLASGGLACDTHLAVTRDGSARSAALSLQTGDFSVRKARKELVGLKSLALVLNVAGIDLDGAINGQGTEPAPVLDLENGSCDLDVQLAGLRTGAVDPVNLNLHLAGSQELMTLKARADGGAIARIGVSGSFRDRLVSISELAASVPSFKCGLNLTGPATLRFSHEEPLPVEVSGFNLQLQPGGRVECSGAYSPESLRAVLRVIDLDTKSWQTIVPSLPPAVINVAASLAGSLQSPAGEVTVRVRDLTLPVEGLAPIGADVKTVIASATDGASISTGVTLDNATRQALGISRFDCTAGLRVPRKGADLDFAGIMNAPLEAAVDYQGTGEQLWALARQPERRFNGKLSLQARAGGTPAQPAFNADFRLSEGRFRDLDFGADVRDIVLKVKAGCEGDISATTVDIDLSCSDGRRRSKGPLSVRGTVHPVTMADTNIRISIPEFSPLHRRDLRAVLSGDISVTGRLTAPDVRGRLSIDRGNVLVEELALPSGSVTTLDLVEGPRENVLALRRRDFEERAKRSSDLPGSLNLDVTVRKFFVEGYGLDTEWRADLRVAGPLTSPGINGEIKADRGRLDMLGRRFDMEEGTVSFAGGTEPFLNLKMTTETTDVAASILMQGSLLKVSSLKPKLVSDPTMPEDDILAYMLFGKPANELSQFELLQLAQNMAMLAAFGTGSGTRGVMRAVTGLDVINIGQDDSGNTSLELGKYIFDSVYAGVEKSSDSNASTKANVRWELGRRTSVGASTDGSETTAGIKWRMDY